VGPVCQRERSRARARGRRLTSGDDVSVVRERERGVGRRWAEGGGGVASAEGGKWSQVWAGIGLVRGREKLLLFFLFSNFYFHFYILFF
jgi:hypothetical protein